MADPLSFDVASRLSPWEVPDGTQDEVRPIAAEIVRLGRRYEWVGDRQAALKKLWVAVNYALGAPAAVAAGLAGIDALAASRNAVSYLAFASAALVALLTFLNPAERAARASQRAAACWAVSMWVRRLMFCELAHVDLAEARTLFAEVQDREQRALEALS